MSIIWLRVNVHNLAHGNLTQKNRFFKIIFALSPYILCNALPARSRTFPPSVQHLPTYPHVGWSVCLSDACMLACPPAHSSACLLLDLHPTTFKCARLETHHLLAMFRGAPCSMEGRAPSDLLIRFKLQICLRQ